MDIILMFAIIGLWGVGVAQLLELKSLSKRLQGLEHWKPEVVLVPQDDSSYEPCYFCGHRFPPDQLTTLDKYRYCNLHKRRG